MPALSSRKPYRIGRARTGLGLFATREIPKGVEIVRYSGPLIDSKKADDLDNRYLFEINGRWTIDGSTRKNVGRYANHSCRPNAESDVQSRKRRVMIRSTKKIQAGEEITYDYGRDYFKAFLKPIGCKCVKCEEKRKAERAELRAKNKTKAARKKARAEKKASKKAVSKKVAKPAKRNVKAKTVRAKKTTRKTKRG